MQQMKAEVRSSTDSGLVSGTFEPNERGGGFLRGTEVHYRIRSSDAVVPPELSRALQLRGGEHLEGLLRPQRGRNGHAPRALGSVMSINGLKPEQHRQLRPFEELTAIDPQRPVRFETPGGPLTMRIVDLMTPIGFGQRGLIAAPPRTGKTVLLQQMAHGIATNHPDVYMMVLLIDERPEEVTDMRRNVRGEVIASSNDQDIASHVRIARLMIEKAKRRVECGEHVVILLDSLTRLGRAFNSARKGTGRIMSGGLDAGALNEPKSIFGAARNVEGGGSLTIIASALIDTGSRMDEVIFNEFKGTGNMEIMLSRNLANRRIWPAIDLSESGTRKEELLLSPDALKVAHSIRRTLVPRGDIRAMEALLEAMGKHPSNAAFVASVVGRAGGAQAAV
jgi:transcription termination factor Rho